MKVNLSGKDWLVSPFLPDEAGGHYSHIKKVVAGNLYGGWFMPATVPGDVQSDAMDAGVIGDVSVGYNAMQAEWTHGRDWMYVRRFTPEKVDCKKILLCFDGVDYACDVFLNGEWIGSHEIAWIPFQFDVTDKIKVGEENCLIVLVKAAPYEQSQGGSCNQVHTLKARFAYGWDFCTRLVPLGIWRDVYVEYRKSGYSKKFLAEHEGEIILHKAAKKAFDELGLKKIPTVRSLQEEYAELLAQKKVFLSYTHRKFYLSYPFTVERIIRPLPTPLCSIQLSVGYCLYGGEEKSCT